MSQRLKRLLLLGLSVLMLINPSLQVLASENVCVYDSNCELGCSSPQMHMELVLRPEFEAEKDKLEWHVPTCTVKPDSCTHTCNNWWEHFVNTTFKGNKSTEETPEGGTDSSNSVTVEKDNSATLALKKAESFREIKYALTKLWSVPGAEGLDAAVQEVSTMITVLRAFGWSDSAIIGALISAYHESGFFPYAIEGQRKLSGLNGFKQFYANIGGTSYGLKVDGVKAEFANEREYNEAFNSTDRFTLALNDSEVNLDSLQTSTSGRGFGLFQFTDWLNQETQRASTRGSLLLTVGSHLTELPTTAIIKLPAGTRVHRFDIPLDDLKDEVDVTEHPYKPFSNFVSIPGVEIQCALLNSSFRIDTDTKLDPSSEDTPSADGRYLQETLKGFNKTSVGEIDILAQGVRSSAWLQSDYIERVVPEDYAQAIRDKYGEFISYKYLNEDWKTSALAFLLCMERPAEEHAKTRADEILSGNQTSAPYIIANMVLNSDIDFGLNSNLASLSSFGFNTGSQSDTMTYLQGLTESGFFTESALTNYAALSEINIDAVYLVDAIRDNLSSQELKTLSDWERNVEVNSFENTMVIGARKILVFFGILVEVWAILLYISYWFDKLNNFIPIDLLCILSLGRLRITDDEREATYSLRDNSSRSKVKTVNHRAILFIVVISLAFGTLIITGKIFFIFEELITKVKYFLG